MKTVINIGTNINSIVGVEFDKPFEDITYSDILEVVWKHCPGQKLRVQGWANVTYKDN